MFTKYTRIDTANLCMSDICQLKDRQVCQLKPAIVVTNTCVGWISNQIIDAWFIPLTPGDNSFIRLRCLVQVRSPQPNLWPLPHFVYLDIWYYNLGVSTATFFIWRLAYILTWLSVDMAQKIWRTDPWCSPLFSTTLLDARQDGGQSQETLFPQRWKEIHTERKRWGLLKVKNNVCTTWTLSQYVLGCMLGKFAMQDNRNVSFPPVPPSHQHVSAQTL